MWRMKNGHIFFEAPAHSTINSPYLFLQPHVNKHMLVSVISESYLGVTFSGIR